MQHAAQLLRSDEASIDEIIDSCGFQNTGYFYWLFRRQYDTTPRAFRFRYLRDPFQSNANNH
jgi:AraC-like DNA-binding protein